VVRESGYLPSFSVTFHVYPSCDCRTLPRCDPHQLVSSSRVVPDSAIRRMLPAATADLCTTDVSQRPKRLLRTGNQYVCHSSYQSANSDGESGQCRSLVNRNSIRAGTETSTKRGVVRTPDRRTPHNPLKMEPMRNFSSPSLASTAVSSFIDVTFLGAILHLQRPPSDPRRTSRPSRYCDPYRKGCDCC
jgi:hypothetical protein